MSDATDAHRAAFQAHQHATAALRDIEAASVRAKTLVASINEQLSAFADVETRIAEARAQAVADWSLSDSAGPDLETPDELKQLDAERLEVDRKLSAASQAAAILERRRADAEALGKESLFALREATARLMADDAERDGERLRDLEDEAAIIRGRLLGYAEVDYSVASGRKLLPLSAITQRLITSAPSNSLHGLLNSPQQRHCAEEKTRLREQFMRLMQAENIEGDLDRLLDIGGDENVEHTALGIGAAQPTKLAPDPRQPSCFIRVVDNAA